MSPIRLADVDSDNDGSEAWSYSHDGSQDGLHGRSRESTYPRIDGEWAIGDEVNEPVAIVGIGTVKFSNLSTKTSAYLSTGCRLPGEVKSAADLWDLLKDAKSGHGRVPKDRWNIEAFHHENGGEKIGSMSMVCIECHVIAALAIFLSRKMYFEVVELVRSSTPPH